jgi:hypothetical protein
VPFEHLGVAAGVEGLWDVHPADALGGDESGRGEVFVQLRGAYRWPFGLALGAEARWDVSGADAPDLALDASRLSLRALASLRVDDVLVSMHAGYRFDGSARSAGPIERYRRGDRVSLGVSSFDAVLLGVAAVWTLEPVELLAEATFEPWVGDAALETSALRGALGARARIVDELRAHLTLELTGQTRPALEPGSPLVPTEPRLAVIVGVSFSPRWGGESPPAEERPADDEPDAHAAPSEPPPDAQAVASPPTDEPPVASAPRGALRGLVRDFAGRALSARVAIEPGGHEARTDRDGFFELELEPGEYEVRMEAPGHAPQTRRVRVQENGVVILNADLRRQRR